MGTISNLFLPKEVKKALKALKYLEKTYTPASLPINHLTASVALRLKKKETRKKLPDNQTEQLLLKFIGGACQEQVFSGNYHIYRGILSQEGNDISNYFGQTLDKMLAAGFIDEATATASRKDWIQKVKELG